MPTSIAARRVRRSSGRRRLRRGEYPGHKIRKTTPCKVERLPSRSHDNAGVNVLRIVDAVDAKSEQAEELAPVFRKVGQFAERFGGEQRPSPQHFRLNLRRKLPVVDPNALGLVQFDVLAEAGAEQTIDLFDAAF